MEARQPKPQLSIASTERSWSSIFLCHAPEPTVLHGGPTGTWPMRPALGVRQEVNQLLTLVRINGHVKVGGLEVDGPSLQEGVCHQRL